MREFRSGKCEGVTGRWLGEDSDGDHDGTGF